MDYLGFAVHLLSPAFYLDVRLAIDCLIIAT